MNSFPLLDPASAALVIFGTLAATLLRCGWVDSRAALSALAQLFGPRFNPVHARAELAIQVQEIEEDGLVRAGVHHIGDGEFDEMTDALLKTRTIEALYERHTEHRVRRIESARRAGTVLARAAELAPVLGLVGTLVSLGGLSTAVAEDGDYARAIAMAVATTLYGLVAANFVFAPLAAVVTRRAEQEDTAREEIIAWLLAAVETSCQKPNEPARNAA